VKYKHYQRSKHIVPYPTLLAVNEASKLHTTKDLLQVALHRHDDAPNGVGTRQRRSERSERPDAGGVKLPAARLVPRDFAATCRSRYSPGPDFVLGKVDSTALSTLLWEALGCAAAQLSEMAPGRPHDLPRVSVAFCAHGVDGIRDGAYRYHPETHSVTLVRPGDHRLRLQQGMPIPTVNLFQVPLCFHLVGSLEDVLAAYGTRGYRMLQMEVGMVLQRLLLSAAALGMNGHPLLGYDERVCDDTYHLSSHEETCLIQVPVGFYRKTARFEGTLQVW
jgi:SagB-type dehydrogenase family enzyme